MADRYQPKPEDRFTFGLWTVGSIGRDPFGDPVREPKSPADLVYLLGEVGAYGVNFHDNADVIRAVAYIKVDWMPQEMWQAELANNGLYWGDSRIEASEVIKALWLEEIQTDFWLHGSPKLFDLLGYGDER